MNTPEDFEEIKNAAVKAILDYANTIQSLEHNDLADIQDLVKLQECYKKSLITNMNYRVFVQEACHSEKVAEKLATKGHG